MADLIGTWGTVVGDFGTWGTVAGVYLGLFTLIYTACTYRLSLKENERNNRLVRAKIVTEFFHNFTEDATMQKVFYKIEYGKFFYDEKTFHESKAEKEVDKLLRHFSNLALMWETKVLDLEDVIPVEYFIFKIVQNPEIQKYLNSLKPKKVEYKNFSHPYDSLMKLAETFTKR